jgi:putative endonuclease
MLVIAIDRMGKHMRGGLVYLMTNRKNGTLYCGVTSDINQRIYDHRTGAYAGFTKRYSLHRLVWMDYYEDITDAIQRETSIKKWPRAWKVRLIHQANPDWDDLYDLLA